jgi:hypothetical protein
VFRSVIGNVRFRSVVVEAAIALILFLGDPLGLAEQKHRSIDAGLAVATQYLHADPPANLAVVLIDKATLEDWKVDWPITYGKSAELIHALACARATGVFFDFSVGRKFNLIEGRDNLKRVVEDSSQDGSVCVDGRPPAKIPVFFGRIEGADSPMTEWLAERNASFFLYAGETDSVYQAGKEQFPPLALRQDEVSPAFGLVRALPFLRGKPVADDGSPCRDGDARSRCWRAPLALIWSAVLDRKQPNVSDILKCRGDRGPLHLLWALTPFGTDERYESCPPVLTLSGVDLARDLAFIDKYGDPAAALAGRFVMVGVDIAGLNDRVTTPLHDHLPGVYKHAVALGALLRYDAHYPTLPKPGTLGVMVAVIYLLLEAAREFSRGRKLEFVWVTGAFVACVVAFSTIVYLQYWPASLVVAVFGYYVGVVFAFFVVAKERHKSPSRKSRSHSTKGTSS